MARVEGHQQEIAQDTTAGTSRCLKQEGRERVPEPEDSRCKKKAT